MSRENAARLLITLFCYYANQISHIKRFTIVIRLKDLRYVNILILKSELRKIALACHECPRKHITNIPLPLSTIENEPKVKRDAFAGQ